MNDKEARFIRRINEAISECESFLFITRCSNLQREALDSIQERSKEVARAKVQAIEEDNEKYANILLGLQCATAALSSELRMYLALKDEDPDAAWDHLIDAQNALATAVRAHEGFKHCSIRWERLQKFEEVVFPLQVYTSVGTIVHVLECSICGEDYEQCQHLAGLPYMGQMCSTIVTSAELDHIALVETPADKRCRIQTFSLEGVQRNCMTLREEGQVEDGITVGGRAVVFRES